METWVRASAAGKPEIAQRLVSAFLDAGSAQIDAVESAASSGNAALTAATAHRLKGSLQTFRDADSVTVAAEVERYALDGELARAQAALVALRIEVERLLSDLRLWSARSS